MSTLDDLIARLEAATEGSRELDARIEATKWPPDPEQTFSFHADSHSFGIRRGEATAIDEARGNYTSSIDAALTLIPGTANCHGYDLSPISGIDAFFSRNNVKDGHWIVEGSHKTSVPLAFCIAALKARARSAP